MPTRVQRERVAGVIGTALFHSPWLHRLGRISFLGTLDDHPRSRNATTRLEHSIGVAELGVQAARALGLARGEARTFVAACLLHDIGHYPLSHAAEPAFTRVLGANHHKLSRWIIRGEGPIGEARSLRAVLERLKIDPEAVWALIDGSESDGGGEGARIGLGELLHARINLDTLEGIARVARCFRVRKRQMPEQVFVPDADSGELCIAPDALPAIDDFWGLKDRVYDEVINLPSNILAEARLCELVAAEIGDGVFSTLEQFDDVALGRVLGPRFEEIRLRAGDDSDYVLSNHGGPGQVLVRTRKRYYVDARAKASDAPLSFRRWRERYRHEKVRSFLISRHRQLELPGLDMADPPIFAAPEI